MNEKTRCASDTFKTGFFERQANVYGHHKLMNTIKKEKISQ